MEFSIVEGKKLNSLNCMSDGYRYNKTENLREIFNIECRSSSRTSLSFKAIESTLSKRRRIELPKLASSAEEFSELVLQSPFLVITD